MKAINIRSCGGPEVLEYTDVPKTKTSKGETLVKTEFSGINYIDIYHRTGLYPLALPFIPGLEAAGTLENGDRVAYAAQLGSYAEYCSVPSWKLVKIPDSISTEHAAALMLQGMTAHYLSHSTHNIRKEETVLIHAAAGGVGLLLVQIAKMKGAEVIGTVSAREKAALAKNAGADYAIIYTEDDFEEETKKITEEKGVDVVYDSVGKSTFLKSLRCLKTRGHMVSFGQSGGPVQPLDIRLLSESSLTLTRPRLSDYCATRGELLSRAESLFEWVSSGEIKLHIYKKFRLEKAGEAHRELESRKTAGKLLLIP